MSRDDPQPIEWDYLCSLAEAAAIAEVSKTTIRRRLAKRKVIGTKIGRTWVIDVRSLDLINAPDALWAHRQRSRWKIHYKGDWTVSTGSYSGSTNTSAFSSSSTFYV